MFGRNQIYVVLQSIEQKLDRFSETVVRLESVQLRQAEDLASLKTSVGQLSQQSTEQRTLNRVVLWFLGIGVPAVVGMGVWFFQSQILQGWQFPDLFNHQEVARDRN